MIGWMRATTAAAAMVLMGAPIAAPVAAQVQRVDPDAQMDTDLGSTARRDPVPAEPPSDPLYPDVADTPATSPDFGPASAPETTVPKQPVTDASGFERDDLIGAAGDLFGQGAQDIARLIERILADQGKPIGYIEGREASGAFVVGVRYGSGILHHKIEGIRPVYWTGPSIGFDVGGNAAKSFVLVYNLYDTQDLFRRFPQGEGAAYFVGGFTASYLRRGDIVLIPIRLGVGVRLGANIGYMKFREKNSWVPF